jgi:hypothetical protein
MASVRASADVLDQEFLPIRAKILEVAAALDRVDRAGGSITADRRMSQVQVAIQVLLRPDGDRAEKVQLIFSRPYEGDWRDKMGV